MVYKSIDLFAGIGGIRLGFDLAFKRNIRTVFVSEFDKNAVKTYQTNFAKPKTIFGDITKIEAQDIPQFDICLAGFPCQAFSIAGKRLGLDDNYKGMARGTLFAEVIRICNHHKPKVIFCENVKGLIMHDHGNTFAIIKGAFEEIGYKVFYKVLNSKDFGVAQNRERIYIVAFRNDIAPEVFEFPDGNNRPAQTLGDIIEENPVSVKYYLSEVYLACLERHKERQRARGHGFGYVIKDYDDIANTIVCGGMGRERNLIIDDRIEDLTPVTHVRGPINNRGIRRLTPREWARLQGFPDDYRLILSDVNLYKQLGNSVSVPVIEAIARRIREVLRHADR